MAHMQKVSDTPDHHMPRVLIVCGPTASGKTNLAVSLAKRFDGELVSADSRQIYKYVDVITGKDLPLQSRASVRQTLKYRDKEYTLVTHTIDTIPVWMYDVMTPDEQCSISLYRFLANAAISDILSRGKLPVIVGGAGLYIDSIVHPPETIDIPPDLKAREYRNTLTAEALQADLASLDPERLAMMNISDRNNPRRLIRAIEIAQWQAEHDSISPTTRGFDCYWVGIKWPIDILSARIRARVNERWGSGAIDEVKRLKALYKVLPGAEILGFIPIMQFLDKRVTEAEAKDTWVNDEIAYAKRQMVWFKRQKDIHWVDGEQKGIDRQVEKDVRQWYTKE